MLFGGIIVGPPGAGKTTFCDAMQQMFTALARTCVVINLDPANDYFGYPCSIDLRSLISLDDVMKEKSLGPNGALMFCMEYLYENFDWLTDQLQDCIDKGVTYFLFDCPGQVELYTHETFFLKCVRSLIKKFDARLTAIHLMDSVVCTEATKYISGLLTSLSCQLLLELPHINLLTKVDLLQNYKKSLIFRLDYYTQVQDLNELLRSMALNTLNQEHPMQKKFLKLQKEICDLVDSFNVISFLPLNIQCKKSMLHVIRQIDLANGYSLSASYDDPFSLFKITVGPNFMENHMLVEAIQEKYIDTSDSEVSLEDNTRNVSL